MRIESTITDDALLDLLGERLAEVRLSKNLTQAELAEQAGVGVRTVQRLELGAAATQLSGFIRICRALGLVERFEALVPEQGPSPMAQLRARGKRRRRASGMRVSEPKPPKWTWGDEA